MGGKRSKKREPFWAPYPQFLQDRIADVLDTGCKVLTVQWNNNRFLEEDIDDPDKYITIPHKNDLELGKTLEIEFTTEYLPKELDRVDSIFRSRGAYSRYKDLIDEKGLLYKWHKFEDERQKIALKKWCRENRIEIEG